MRANGRGAVWLFGHLMKQIFKNLFIHSSEYRKNDAFVDPE
jgi:hypothetical protein